MFTGIKTASHKKLNLVSPKLSRMRACVDAALRCAPAGVRALDAETLRESCLALYNQSVITKFDSAPSVCAAGSDKIQGGWKAAVCTGLHVLTQFLRHVTLS